MISLTRTLFKSEVNVRFVLGTPCIVKKTNLNLLKPPVVLLIHTTYCNVENVCFEMALVPVVSLKWIQLTNRSCYCLVQCFLGFFSFPLKDSAVCLLLSVSLNLQLSSKQLHVWPHSSNRRAFMQRTEL